MAWRLTVDGGPHNKSYVTQLYAQRPEAMDKLDGKKA